MGPSGMPGASLNLSHPWNPLVTSSFSELAALVVAAAVATLLLPQLAHGLVIVWGPSAPLMVIAMAILFASQRSAPTLDYV